MTSPLHQARIPAFVFATIALAWLTQPGMAQRYSVTVDPDSIEGQYLDLVNLQSDESKKLSLLEQFTQRFPQHQAVKTRWSGLPGGNAGFRAGVVLLCRKDMSACPRVFALADCHGT